MCVKAVKQYVLLLTVFARPSADWLRANKFCVRPGHQTGPTQAAGPLEQASIDCHADWQC